MHSQGKIRLKQRQLHGGNAYIFIGKKQVKMFMNVVVTI